MFEPDDELHQRCVAWSRILSERALVTEYVLWEGVNHLSSPPDRPKAHALVEHILARPGYEFVRASRELLESGLELHRSRLDNGWSLTDCISFVVMQNRRVTRALSWDVHFEQAGFVALLRQVPPQR